MRISVSRTKLVLTVETAVVLGLLLSASLVTPDRMGPFWITVWFVGLLIALSGGFSLLFYWWKRLWHKSAEADAQFGQSLRQAVVFSTWLTALIALNSLRQLGFKDLLLVTILVLVIDFYLKRLEPTLS